jgi:hypothetical protein
MLYQHRSRIQQDHNFQQSRPPISSEQDAHVAARTEHQQHQQLQYTKHTNRQSTSPSSASSAYGVGGGSTSPPALTEIQTQLHDAQSPLESHVNKVRVVIAKHNAVKREIGLLGECVEKMTSTKRLHDRIVRKKRADAKQGAMECSRVLRSGRCTSGRIQIESGTWGSITC